MKAPRSSFGYWLCVGLGAVLVLAGGSSAASYLRQRVTLESIRLHGTPKIYKVDNNRDGRPMLTIHNAKPGESGRRRMVLANIGNQPFRKVVLRQDRVSLGGVGAALQLQIYDGVARRCLYPRAVGASDRCAEWMPFDGSERIQNYIIPGRTGRAEWKRGERHAIDIRWRLADTSPNVDQGKRASFRLTWVTVQ